MHDIGTVGAKKHNQCSGGSGQFVQRADEPGTNVWKREIRSRSACWKKIGEVGGEGGHARKDEGKKMKEKDLTKGDL
jgi:hypothetical protein